MKRILLFTLVIGMFAVQVDAAIYNLDATAARQFTQQSTNSVNYTLDLVIDNPGTVGSTTYLEANSFNGADNNVATNDTFYGSNMLYAVGFAGSLTQTTNPGMADPELWIGKAIAAISPEVGTTDTLSIAISNDNDDKYVYTAWYSTDSMSSIVQGADLTLTGKNQGIATVTLGATAPTHFGFSIELVSGDVPDSFHTSIVPVPGAVLLGILGLSAAGIKLRKYA